MIPKTATTSLSKSLDMIHIHLAPSKLFSDKPLPNSFVQWWKPDRGDVNYGGAFCKRPINYCSAEELKDYWNDFFTFTFVRNPWDRVASQFLYTQNSKNIKHGFNKFVKLNFKDKAKEGINCSHHNLQTKWWINDEKGNQRVSFIGRFERLQDDYDYICKTLNIENKLSKENFHEKKCKREHYSLYYNQESIDIIAEHYKWDIQNLNYDFENKK